MSIEPLPEKYYKCGYRFDLVRAEYHPRKAFVIYRRTSWDQLEVYWDFRILHLVDGLSRRRSRRGPPWYYSHWGQPSVDSWGVLAWTFNTRRKAEAKMKTVLEFEAAGGPKKYMDDLRRALVGRVYRPRAHLTDAANASDAPDSDNQKNI